MARPSVSEEEAAGIKRALWDGYRQADVAAAFTTSAATVSRIATGRLYPDVPWPDGSTGVMSPDRYRAAVRSAKAAGEREIA